MTQINKTIDVNAYYFAGSTMRSFPREIQYAGRAITFATGLRLMVSGAQLFDMNDSDGLTYRLANQGSTWQLLGVF